MSDEDTVISSGARLEQYLKTWLDTTKPSIRERTWVRYEQYVRLHALPAIGKLSLEKLTPQHLQRLYADRLKAGCHQRRCTTSTQLYIRLSARPSGGTCWHETLPTWSTRPGSKSTR
jgi:hypothetical protein